ncbi:recombinase family protein [Nocardia sp. NPDC049190]|uniref:recombinase family protein n=1 Tax=Nocardia sp. NPDC049190 TaxID=3155650 RepID=UPI0033C02097
MEFGYARVSTTHQDLERQLVALREYGISDDRIYTDHKTSATMDRPGWVRLQRMLRESDRIVATNLDRYGRNLRECLNIVHELREQGGLSRLDVRRVARVRTPIVGVDWSSRIRSG